MPADLGMFFKVLADLQRIFDFLFLRSSTPQILTLFTISMTSLLRFLTAVTTLICTVGSSHAQSLDAATFFNGEENEAYLQWLGNVDTYDRSVFLPSPAGNSTGSALHWKIQGDEIFLAMAAKATGWVGFGIAEAGGYVSDAIHANAGRQIFLFH